MKQSMVCKFETDDTCVDVCIQPKETTNADGVKTVAAPNWQWWAQFALCVSSCAASQGARAVPQTSPAAAKDGK